MSDIKEGRAALARSMAIEDQKYERLLRGLEGDLLYSCDRIQHIYNACREERSSDTIRAMDPDDLETLAALAIAGAVRVTHDLAARKLARLENA